MRRILSVTFTLLIAAALGVGVSAGERGNHRDATAGSRIDSFTRTGQPVDPPKNPGKGGKSSGTPEGGVDDPGVVTVTSAPASLVPLGTLRPAEPKGACEKAIFAVAGSRADLAAAAAALLCRP